MAALIGIAVNPLAVLAAHVTLQLMDGRRPRPAVRKARVMGTKSTFLFTAALYRSIRLR